MCQYGEDSGNKSAVVGLGLPPHHMVERDKLIATAKAYSRTDSIPSDIRGLISKLVKELEHSVPVFEGR